MDSNIIKEGLRVKFDMDALKPGSDVPMGSNSRMYEMAENANKNGGAVITRVQDNMHGRGENLLQIHLQNTPAWQFSDHQWNNRMLSEIAVVDASEIRRRLTL